MKTHTELADNLYQIRELIQHYRAEFSRRKMTSMSKRCVRAEQALDKVRALFADVAAIRGGNHEVYFNGRARVRRAGL